MCLQQATRCYRKAAKQWRSAKLVFALPSFCLLVVLVRIYIIGGQYKAHLKNVEVWHTHDGWHCIHSTCLMWPLVECKILRGWMIFSTSRGQRSCNSKIQAVYCMTLEHHPTRSTSRIVYYLPPLLALLSKCCQTGHWNSKRAGCYVLSHKHTRAKRGTANSCRQCRKNWRFHQKGHIWCYQFKIWYI